MGHEYNPAEVDWLNFDHADSPDAPPYDLPREERRRLLEEWRDAVEEHRVEAEEKLDDIDRHLQEVQDLIDEIEEDDYETEDAATPEEDSGDPTDHLEPAGHSTEYAWRDRFEEFHALGMGSFDVNAARRKLEETPRGVFWLDKYAVKSWWDAFGVYFSVPDKMMPVDKDGKRIEDAEPQTIEVDLEIPIFVGNIEILGDRQPFIFEGWHRVKRAVREEKPLKLVYFDFEETSTFHTPVK
jgi:hypothetical protein